MFIIILIYPAFFKSPDRSVETLLCILWKKTVWTCQLLLTTAGFLGRHFVLPSLTKSEQDIHEHYQCLLRALHEKYKALKRYFSPEPFSMHVYWNKKVRALISSLHLMLFPFQTTLFFTFLKGEQNDYQIYNTTVFSLSAKPANMF